MAFVYRAGRFDDRGAGGASCDRTPGPGSYNLRRPTGDSSTDIAPSLAPFNSTAVRAINDDYTFSSVTPGPGSYSIASQSSTSASASTAFRSGVQRFESRAKASLEPGPGSYGGHQQWLRHLAVQEQRQKSSVAYKRRHPRLQWTRVGTAPSIPARTQSYGYQQNSDGDLETRKAPVDGHTGVGLDRVGPGSYNVDDRALRTLRTCSFGRSQSTRQVFGASTTPGPGAYNLRASSSSEHAPPPRCSTAFASKVTRFAAAGAGKGMQDAPGPGSYELSTPMVPEVKLERSQQPFSKCTVRGGAVVSSKKASSNDADAAAGNPGPGSYNLSSNTPFQSRSEVLQRDAALGIQRNAGFLNSETRFREIQNGTPGPGAYDLEMYTRSAASGRQQHARAGMSAFGSSSSRFSDNNNRNNRSKNRGRTSGKPSPGPGSYSLSNADAKPKYQQARPSHMFKSKTSRFRAGARNDATPAPNSYNVSRSWTRSNRSSRAGGALSQQHRNVFISSEPRFANTAMSTPGADTPGPGSYSLAGKCTRGGASIGVRSVFQSGERRFAVDKHRLHTPGPGTYDLVAPDSMLKRSFNITIGDDYEAY